MSKFRAATTAVILFIGVVGSMGALGALVFEEALAMTLYGTGVTAGAGYLAAGTYRSSRGNGAAS